MKIPKVFGKDGHEYIFVKEYKNFVRYKDMLTGTMECFSRHELGLIKKQATMRQANKHHIK